MTKIFRGTCIDSTCGRNVHDFESLEELERQAEMHMALIGHCVKIEEIEA